MESAKCAAELRKIIKYSKNCGENDENLAIFTLILMATFGTKSVHSALWHRPQHDPLPQLTHLQSQ